MQVDGCSQYVCIVNKLFKGHVTGIMSINVFFCFLLKLHCIYVYFCYFSHF